MNMLEKVATAIGKNIKLGIGGTPDTITIDVHDAAIAAIEAMREPTDAMVEHYTYNTGEWSRSTCNAMLDAALAETSVNNTPEGEK